WHAAGNFQIRLGWAKTYGRPDFWDIAPNVTRQPSLSNSSAPLLSPQTSGTIEASNPALKPWSADNFELSLEHYSDHGGLATLSFFQKNVKDFFGDVARTVTSADLATFGLDSSYLGWTLDTQTNMGSERISGVSL